MGPLGGLMTMCSSLPDISITLKNRCKYSLLRRSTFAQMILSP
jgi:hypothetical protein